MSKRCTAAVVLMTAVLIICQIFPVKAADDENLYALSAVLMDGETGRVLYGKEAYKGRPNASTTKVMTCILALELAKGDDYVQVSRNAASQPQTRLGTVSYTHLDVYKRQAMRGVWDLKQAAPVLQNTVSVLWQNEMGSH